MAIHVNEGDVMGPQQVGGKKIIGEENGCVAGFCMGLAYYTEEEYVKPGIHDDQEGFFVLKGEGYAKVGDEEFPLKPGTFFVALKGVPHTIKVARGKGPIKVLWTHGAV